MVPYIIPADAKPNVWWDYEFPTLQRSTTITQAIRVINVAPYDTRSGRLPNDPSHLKVPPSDTDSQVSSLLY